MRANCNIVQGDFHGGLIEPGTFHNGTLVGSFGHVTDETNAGTTPAGDAPVAAETDTGREVTGS